jgi:chromosome segregation ATPase
VSFNYEKHKSTDGHGSMWTSYSDLFLGLSIIFLLLYVTVSLRQSTDGIQSHIESQKVARENEDLKQQLKVYEALKQDYLEKSATKEDSASYQELMDQLDLLQTKADQEKNELRQQALEHEKKERALNKYQQMVRNIINSNMVAKGRIKTRDQLIENQDQKLETNQQEIQSLEQTVGEKKAQLALNEQKISGLNQTLEQKLKMLKASYKHQKINQKNFEKQKKQLEMETRAQVEALRVRNQTVAQQLNAVNQQLNQTSTQLTQAQASVSKLGEEKSALQGKLEAEQAAYGNQIAKLQGDFSNQRARDKAAFDAALAKEKLSGAAKAAREAKFKAEADAKAQALAGQISKLNGQMKATEAALAGAQENLNARKKLAAQIKNNFAAAGVKADVDLRTGDVLLSFGNNYFDSDRAVLKPEMVSILQKTIPAYSKSLFQDPKVAEKIQNVEIVGFASPTYKGRFIDPTSLDPKDKEAMNHNLDLSLSRAKSIFNAVFDQNKMTFDHQKRLLPLVKVTGRGFLANPAANRSLANESAKSFCEKNDCAKLQTVIIKFNLKD